MFSLSLSLILHTSLHLALFPESLYGQAHTAPEPTPNQGVLPQLGPGSPAGMLAAGPATLAVACAFRTSVHTPY